MHGLLQHCLEEPALLYYASRLQNNNHFLIIDIQDLIMPIYPVLCVSVCMTMCMSVCTCGRWPTRTCVPTLAVGVSTAEASIQSTVLVCYFVFNCRLPFPCFLHGPWPTTCFSSWKEKEREGDGVVWSNMVCSPSLFPLFRSRKRDNQGFSG